MRKTITIQSVDRILDTIKQAEGLISISEITARSGINHYTTKMAVQRLLDDGKIDCIKTTRTHYYQPKTNEVQVDEQ